MLTIEKLGQCPNCGEAGDRWHYDAPQCTACGFNGMTGVCPDFDMLKPSRDAALRRIHAEVCEERGWDPVTPFITACHANGCYCACPDGPCEHTWHDWREFDDGRGGERVCRTCGMGNMAHDMRCAP